MARQRARLASIEVAAEAWVLSPRTIRRRIADGTIKGYKIPGTRAIRVDMNEIEALTQPMDHAA